MLNIKNDITTYAKKRTWWLYLPITLFFFYLFFQYIKDPLYFNTIFGTFNLVIHEAGHYAVFAFAGTFLNILGGTLLETLFPFIFFVAFIKQKDYFGMTFCLGWLATSLFGTATYIGDAQEMNLPLLGGNSVIHDWNYILTDLGILHLDNTLSSIIRGLAIASMIIALGVQIYLISRMFTFRKHGL